MKEKSLLVASALLALSSPLEGRQIKNGRPNVVLIIADDHRYDWMHHKGRTYMETPNLDKLAKQGWSFPNAFSCAGVCSPARASIFTGKYLHQASAPDIVWQNNSFLQLQEMFPQSLHKQGYRTGYIGKFHLGEEEKSKPKPKSKSKEDIDDPEIQEFIKSFSARKKSEHKVLTLIKIYNRKQKLQTQR